MLSRRIGLTPLRAGLPRSTTQTVPFKIRCISTRSSSSRLHHQLLSTTSKHITSQTAPSIRLLQHTTRLYAISHIDHVAPILPHKPRRSFFIRFFYKTFAACGFVVVVLGGVVLGLFAFDASTYKEEADTGDCPVSELALSPERGGPKNLPIARFLVDDEDNEAMLRQKDKPRLVILGSGWGSVALLKSLSAQNYHVTVISPSNYFLFTPLLPSATVGTLELRSLVEPIRRIISRLKGHYIQASAEAVEFSEKLVEVSQEINGEVRRFYLPYDKLVVGVGSKTNTHGVDGLENCNFLKSIGDARDMRSKIITNFERAVLPTTTDEERKKLLSFVVCGGGPTGVEFAAELFDYINEDLSRQYPRILRNEVSVHVIQSRGHILNTYDEALSKYAEEKFQRDAIDVQTNSRVTKVGKDHIQFTQKSEDGKLITKEIPFGLCLWSTGVAQTDFASDLAKSIEKQTNRHALETDSHLRLIGSPLGDVYAIGDCSTVQNKVTDNILTFVGDIAAQKGKEREAVRLTFKDWQLCAKQIKKRFPQASGHLRKLDKLFEQYDHDHSGTLDYSELKELLEQIDSKLTSLPATAQRAHQQGQYLGKKLNKLAQGLPGMQVNDLMDGDIDEAYYKAFEYRHLGSLAYIGNAAIFDFNGIPLSGGLLAMYIWRGAYFAQSVGLRTRFLLAVDWTKRAMFGRDPVTLM